MSKNFLYFSLKHGFTLIELLIVVAIIGVLGAGAMILMNPAAQFQKANDSRRKADLNQIQKAFEVYYQDFGEYPPSTTGNLIDNVAWGTSWGRYMSTLPQDPSSSRNYVYCTPDSQQSYYLYSSLESAGVVDNTSSTSKNNCSPPVSCGSGTTCNYGISSPNVSP